MVVKIEQIREKGFDVDEPVKLELIQSALNDVPGGGLRPEKPFQLKAHLSRVGTGVLLKGQFTAEVVMPCKRCNADVRVTVPSSFTLNLIPESLAADHGVGDSADDDEQGEQAGSFRLDDAEQDVFNGKEIDLDPIVREQLLLALPMSALCKEDCKGLCPQCGQNLNEKQCGCEVRPSDPRWAALKNIKLN